MSLQATNRKSVDVQPQKRISSLQNRINWNLKRLMKDIVTQYQRPSTLAFPKSRNCQSFLEFEYQKKTRDFELQKRNLDFEIAEVPSFSLPKNPRGKTYQAGTKPVPSIAQFTSTLPKAKRFGMLRRDTKSSSYFTAAKGGSNMIIIPIAVSRFVFPTFKACKATRT